MKYLSKKDVKKKDSAAEQPAINGTLFHTSLSPHAVGEREINEREKYIKVPWTIYFTNRIHQINCKPLGLTSALAAKQNRYDMIKSRP